MWCRSFLTAVAAFASAPAWAASPATEAFVSNTRLAVSFLTDTSALAADRSENSGILATADEELRTQPRIIAVLDRRMLPASNTSEALALMGEGLATGRSVAIDPGVSTQAFASPIGIGATMPAAFITVGRLAASRGGSFDTLYAASQIAVLADLKAAYDVYGHTGDDPVLRQVARNEAIAVDGRIEALKRTEAVRD